MPAPQAAACGEAQAAVKGSRCSLLRSEFNSKGSIFRLTAKDQMLYKDTVLMVTTMIDFLGGAIDECC